MTLSRITKTEAPVTSIASIEDAAKRANRSRTLGEFCCWVNNIRLQAARGVGVQDQDVLRKTLRRACGESMSYHVNTTEGKAARRAQNILRTLLAMPTYQEQREASAA